MYVLVFCPKQVIIFQIYDKMITTVTFIMKSYKKSFSYAIFYLTYAIHSSSIFIHLHNDNDL